MLRRFVAGAVALVIIGVLAGPFPPAGAATPADIALTPDVIYRSGVQTWDGLTVDLALDVYELAGDTETDRPLVVWIHGGYFAIGDKAAPLELAHVYDLVRAGFVVASINYRLGPPSLVGVGGGADELASHPELLEAILRAADDGREAVRFMREHAQAYDIHPDRIAVAGASAGGVTALNIGYSAPGPPAADDPYRVAATLSILGSSLAMFADSGEPPAYMINAEQDTLIPFAEAAAMCDALASVGSGCTLDSYDVDHFALYGLRDSYLPPAADWLHAQLARSCAGPPPPEVLDNADAWPLPNGDYRSTRTASNSGIDSSNVHRLEPVWTHDAPGNAKFGNLATNPVVVDDTVYVGTLDEDIHAMDLATGSTRWQVDGDGELFGPTGVAVGWGKVFGTRDRSHAVAVDSSDGTELWSSDLAEHPSNEIDSQPMVLGDCVLYGTSGFGRGSRGSMWALDQATGSVLWQFEGAPDDLWGDPRRNHGGGSWMPPTLDLARSKAYWGTANAYPFPGAPGFPNGSSRPGDNPHTASIVALGLDDGGLSWSNQPYPHDLFDRDMIFTQLVGTSSGEVVVHSGKGGELLGHDADTGALLWRTEVGMHLNDDLTELVGPTTVLPGANGGVITPPAASDGRVYAAVLNAPIEYEGPEEASDGFATELGQFPSQLVAVDAATGAIVWDVDLPGDSFGGVTVVNDLVFTSTFLGQLLAFDRATGAPVWDLQLDGLINGWPAVVGNRIIVPVGLAETPHLVALELAEQPQDPSEPIPLAPSSGTTPRFTG